MKRKIALGFCVTVVALVLFVIGSASRKEALVPAIAQQKKMTSDNQEQLKSLGYVGGAAPTASEQPAATPSPISRKIVRSGEITIRVKSLDSFLRILEKQAQLSGGYVAGMEIDRTGGSDSALVTLKVQPENLSSLVWWLKEQGAVTSEKLTAEDISEQYYDLKARLQNARKLEARLQEMVGTHTAKLSDLLALEEKLSQVRESIESMEGQMRTYDHLVNLATFVIRVDVESPTLAPHKATYGERAIRAWRNSTGALADLIRAIGIAVVVIAPWMVLLIPPVLIAGFLLRRRRLKEGALS